MKIGYILKSFPRLSETFVLTEILELERLGCEVTIFSRYDPAERVPHEVLRRLKAEVIGLEPLLRARFWEAFEIHRRLETARRDAHRASMDAALGYRSREEMRYWLQAGLVAEESTRRGLELLHGHFATGSASVARYAGTIAGLPFSFTAHAKDIYSNEVDVNRLRDLLEAASLVITVSDANRSFLQGIAPVARIQRVYNGLDLERFRSLPPGHGVAGRSAEPLVLSVARLVEKKGLSDLLTAISVLRARGVPATCRIVGSGPMEAQLRSEARDLGLGEFVDFRGDASQEEVVSEHLPAASVFALPCVIAQDGDRDGLPTTLLEAMARGVPVVSTRLPGIPEAVPDGEAGLLCDPADPRGLAAAIARTLTDTAAAERRVRCARLRIERLFDSRRNVRSLADQFRLAVAQHAGVAKDDPGPSVRTGTDEEDRIGVTPERRPQ